MTWNIAAHSCAYALVFGLGVSATPAQASQPISESMADCAGIMRTMAGWVTDPVAGDAMLALSDRWLEASIEQARAEGAHYPAFYAIAMQDEAISEWEERGRTAVFTEDFDDWGEYCRALSADRDLNIYVDVIASN